MARVSCSKCGQGYPAEGVPFCCTKCGGLYDWDAFPDFLSIGTDPSLSGLWKYRPLLGLPDSAPTVTLGEGNTPLIEDDYQGHRIAYKMEFLNPSGSYKDRGSAVLLSFLLSRGVTSAVEDSSGNAGASFAAYASRAGLRARVYVPESASGPKRCQIEVYGAELITIQGPRSAAASAVRQEAERGAVYASHAFLPFGLPGIATIAYELVAQLGSTPGSVIAPVGHGSLLLGIMRGFCAMRKASNIQTQPLFVGVQARECAPVWARYTGQTEKVREGVTLAEGVRVQDPLRGDAILKEFVREQDIILAISEDRILPGRNELARRGIYVEPTSALVWAALEQLVGHIPEPVILVLSGSGFKYAQ
jgi:threonine synthase